jgi:hypothetical protein
MFPILLTLSIFAAGAGLLFLSQATAGVGLVAFGCWLAIVARLVQADALADEHKEKERATAVKAPTKQLMSGKTLAWIVGAMVGGIVLIVLLPAIWGWIVLNALP